MIHIIAICMLSTSVMVVVILGIAIRDEAISIHEIVGASIIWPILLVYGLAIYIKAALRKVTKAGMLSAVKVLINIITIVFVTITIIGMWFIVEALSGYTLAALLILWLAVLIGIIKTIYRNRDDKD